MDQRSLILRRARPGTDWPKMERVRCTSGRSMKVLIVEDEAPDLELHRRVVLDAIPGAVVTDAATLAEALLQVKQNSFDLAVLDLNLQGDRHAGQEVVRELRTKGKTAIVVVSGLDVETYRPLMYANQVWDYFPKPVDKGSLRLVIERILKSQDAGLSSQVSVTPPAGLFWQDVFEDPRWRGQNVRLTVTEKRILLELLKSPNNVVARKALFDLLPSWGGDQERLRSSLSTMISEIRGEFRKVDPNFDQIHSVGSAGYLWRVA